MTLAKTDLYVTTQDYTDFINNVEYVSITQNDLSKLNVDPSILLDNDNFYRSELPLDISKLSILTINLPYLSNMDINEILNDISLTDIPTESAKNTLINVLRNKIQLVPREYIERDQTKSCSDEIIADLEKAVKHGCKLTLDLYEQSIDELFSYNTEPKSSKKFLLRLLEKYPDMYDVMTPYNSRSVSGILIRELYYVQQPDILQQLYTFAVNYPIIIHESEEIKNRRKQIEDLPTFYMSALYNIYGTTNIDFISAEKPHPLESYLVIMPNMMKRDLRQLALQFGMKIPDKISNARLDKYILRFIPAYRNVVTRPTESPLINDQISEPVVNIEQFRESMNIYTDEEIINYFGYTADYDNRYHLLESVLYTLSYEGFMILDVIDSEKSVNMETTMYENVLYIPKPYIVFGTPLKYRIITLDELLDAFSNDTFKKIGGSPKQFYTIPQIRKFIPLLKTVKNKNSQLDTLVDQVLNKINKILTQTIKDNRDINHFKDLLEKSSEELNATIKKVFYDIFFTGMYMRNWLGPGNDYPINESQNYFSYKITPITVLMLTKINKQLNALKSTNNNIYNKITTLPIIEYNNDTYIINIEKLLPLIMSLSNGDNCILASSRMLIQTSTYYLNTLFNELIYEYDSYIVETIS